MREEKNFWITTLQAGGGGGSTPTYALEKKYLTASLFCRWKIGEKIGEIWCAAGLNFERTETDVTKGLDHVFLVRFFSTGKQNHRLLPRALERLRKLASKALRPFFLSFPKTTSVSSRYRPQENKPRKNRDPVPIPSDKVVFADVNTRKKYPQF